jgi:methylated-DNA-[protein]-cysteine S-methyltransferase
MSYFTVYESPIGPLTLVGDERGVRALHFPGSGPVLDASRARPQLFAPAVAQLTAYFAGERRGFELALELAGTPFQRGVWNALRAIPYGATTTYGGLARELGPRLGISTVKPRAVGAAVARTPIPVVIPCHRVLGTDGSLTGYRGGLRRKRALLDFEAAGGDRSALQVSWAQRQLELL